MTLKDERFSSNKYLYSQIDFLWQRKVKKFNIERDVNVDMYHIFFLL